MTETLSTEFSNPYLTSPFISWYAVILIPSLGLISWGSVAMLTF